MKMPALLLLATPLVLPPSWAVAQSIDEVAASEIGTLRPGFVLAVYQDGAMNFLEAFGTVGPDKEEPLTPEHVFAFPALTEAMIGALAQAMDDADILDMDAPLSTLFPLFSPKLGTVTLNQLLSHTAGLDDARIPEGQDWPEAMALLSDRVLFTDPGFIYSRSRYSFPLALRAMEKAAGIPFPDLVAGALFEPLGMTRSTFDLVRAKELGLVTGLVMNNDSTSVYREVEPTAESNGLPVLFSTAGDASQFLAAWMDGAIRGSPPWVDDTLEEGARLPGDPGFRRGIQVDRFAGHLRVFRSGVGMGMGAAFHLFPEANTAVLAWGIGSRPSRTTNLALERVADALGPGDQTPDEALDRALSVMGLEAFREGAEPENAEGAETPGEILPHHPKGWAGIYLNGEYKIELRQTDQGLVYFTGEDELPVTPGPNGAVTAIRADGRVRIGFRLEVDRAGRRYVRQGAKAFLHMGDKER